MKVNVQSHSGMRWLLNSIKCLPGNAPCGCLRCPKFSIKMAIVVKRYSSLHVSAPEPPRRCIPQVSAEALCEAGWPGRDTGTYVGCMFIDYMTLQREGYGLPSTGAVRSLLPLPSHAPS